jgi:Double-GTPase 2
MTPKCSNSSCAAPHGCHEGEDNYQKCVHWLKNNSSKGTQKTPKPVDLTKTNLSWTGEAFKKEDIAQISCRNTPVFIGLIGKADAGKTTFLAMLYTLLLNGKKFKNYQFAGSKTLLGWDQLYHKLKWRDGKVAFPDPTPSEYYRLLHLAVRNDAVRLKDIFLSDASGEVFSLWSQNQQDPNADNARWIYATSTAFMLFIDCEDLSLRKNLAKTEILDIAQMLLHDLKGKPVIVVWSKADKKTAIHPKIKAALQAALQDLFADYQEIDISNFSMDEPDERVQENNLKVIDGLLERLFVPTGQPFQIDSDSKNDLLLNYKGK